MKKFHTYPQEIQHSNIEIDIKGEIILVIPHSILTNEDIALFNNEIFNKIKNLKYIEEIHLDLRAIQELPFFFIGSILSIFSKLKSVKIKIKNASLSTINALNEYGLDKIFTTNS